MRYTLDTNVLLFYVRDQDTRRFIEENYAPFGDENESIISIVSVAEIYSLAAKHKWGEIKLKVVEKLLNDLIIVEIRYKDLINMYVDIETFSNKSNPAKVKKGNAVKMGKNDIWIAATTAITNSKLITSDDDFDHLGGEYFEVVKYTSKG
ncbi:type II toxin-antitoxin system VapC family toxin [Neolewinella lacunae]|uniref:Type II toxin-antitoxin system VapC family toxin n=1 Tax=Neolewinella lacunae TaxID=1517758 RepID=A0A923T9B2_9BACT|nr:type II toxin-antitoxin system VapC family toxin [Neolewinella lacunae]MBC6995381.1 type II toxin-antitoxin system VapC family toxin [Neolewinella lacunae]MDN3633093.1 type II toxin-antitoxin system VapC family toxin [Neolewinella lacunae]